MSEVLELAADIAEALGSVRYRTGADCYAPERARAQRPKPTIFLGDGGAIEAIKSGDITQMREALARLRAS